MQKNILLSVISCYVLISCSTTTTNKNLSRTQLEEIKMCKATLPVAKKLKTESVSMSCIATMVISKTIGDNNPTPLLCIAGGASGFLFGDSIAERKCTYLTLESQLDGEIAHAVKLNKGFDVLFAQQAKDLAALQLKAGSISKQIDADEENLARLKSLNQDIDKQLQDDRNLVSLLKDEFRFKQETLKKSTSLDQSGKEQQLLDEIIALQRSIKTLQKNSYQLAKLKQEINTPELA